VLTSCLVRHREDEDEGRKCEEHGEEQEDSKDCKTLQWLRRVMLA
jgi:hypothetical protein